MATPSIKTTLKLDGEKEYKSALSEINSALKVLNSEMKLTKEQFADQADSVEALTAEHDVLERQYLSQKKKVDTLRAALEQVGQTYGEASAKTNSYRTSLNNAETDLLKLERALKDNEAAMDQIKQSSSDMANGLDGAKNSLSDLDDAADDSKSALDKLKGVFQETTDDGMALGDMVDKITGIMGISLPDGIKAAMNALGPMSGTFAVVGGAAVGLGTAIAAIEKALAGITIESASTATEIKNTSDVVNMSIESIQLWDYVLKSVGSSMQEAQGDLSAFQEKIMEASEGAGEAFEMFGKLGVSVTDQNGNLRDTESVLSDVVAALQTMQNETERNAISSTLLGGTGEKLIPIYEQNAESLQALMDKKREMGILTGEEIEKLDAVSKALIDYEERCKSAGDLLAQDFAPSLKMFIDEAGEQILMLAESAESSRLVAFFGSILDLVTALGPAVEIFGTALEATTPIWAVASIAISGVADALNLVLEVLSALFNGGISLILELFGLNPDWSSFDRNMSNLGKFFSGEDLFLKKAWNDVWDISSIEQQQKEYEEYRRKMQSSYYYNGSWGGNASGGYFQAGTNQWVPYNAPGIDNFPGGVTWVGENGPEQVYLPRGTQILNAQESRLTGGDVFYITIEARTIQEFMDIVRMAQAQRRLQRMGG